MEHSQRSRDEAAQLDTKSDVRTSASVAGRQVEEEPARGRRMGDKPELRADLEIRADIDAQLAGADDFDPNRVELLVQNGIVVMLGRVADYATKRRLEDLCASVRGVREIHDQLQVEGETLSQSSDGLRTEAPRADFRGPETPRGPES